MNLIYKIINRLFTLCIKHRFASFGKSVIKYKPQILMGLENIYIGNKTVIDSDVQLTTRVTDEYGKPKLTIGNGCLIRKSSHITAINKIEIGNNLLTGTNVLISDNSHGKFEMSQLDTDPKLRPLYSKGPVIIGNNVWLGNNVCVLAGVTIGDGVVVGANSVVTHDIPPYSVAAGIPAKVIKTLTEK